MKNLFEARFEEELQKIKNSIHKKGGVKKAVKVHERIGRAKQKYPSVHSYYHIHLIQDNATKQVIEMSWEKDEQLHEQKLHGLGDYIFFARIYL